jgi:hypothetical protein
MPIPLAQTNLVRLFELSAGVNPQLHPIQINLIPFWHLTGFAALILVTDARNNGLRVAGITQTDTYARKSTPTYSYSEQC